MLDTRPSCFQGQPYRNTEYHKLLVLFIETKREEDHNRTKDNQYN